MKKTSIEQFINRYNLGGEVESVKIESNDSQMKVSFISDDKTLLGSVVSEETDFPNNNFFSKTLTVLDLRLMDEVSLSSILSSLSLGKALNTDMLFIFHKINFLISGEGMLNKSLRWVSNESGSVFSDIASVFITMPGSSLFNNMWKCLSTLGKSCSFALIFVFIFFIEFFSAAW